MRHLNHKDASEKSLIKDLQKAASKVSDSPLRCWLAMFFVASRLVVPLLLSSVAAALKDPVCVLIGASISSKSDVYYPGTPLTPLHFKTSNDLVLKGDPLYAKGVFHWASSSSQVSKCVVEPGTAADVGKIVRTSVSLRSHKKEANFVQAQHRWINQNPFRSKSHPHFHPSYVKKG